MEIATSTLGFPRIGPARELKQELERYWAGKSTSDQLIRAAMALRVANWALQHANGISRLPSNDFSLYDHVLDTSAMVGAIPSVYGWDGGSISLDTYFAMARGDVRKNLPALEMTKWFDTNYHYMVPELTGDQSFTLASTKPLDEYLEAASVGLKTRPVLLGPVTYLILSKSKDNSLDTLSLLPRLLPVYCEILQRLEAAGADWVQIDEPALVLDLSERVRAAYQAAFARMTNAAPGLRLLLATYFGELGDNLAVALRLPIAGLHLDLVRAPWQLEQVSREARPDLVLSLGVVDGRNIWRADLNNILDQIEPVVEKRGADKIVLAPSCSLLHVPLSAAKETKLDKDLRCRLAFATEKAQELSALSRGLSAGRSTIHDELSESARVVELQKRSHQINDESVQRRLAELTPEMHTRKSGFSVRRDLQHQHLNLPLFPTTTIGSFPQTDTIRKARASHGRGSLSDANYRSSLRCEIESAIRWQEEIGIDVLVHGEFERNDMVQYFGEQLRGFAFTEHGWVQSYGSRYVRPPIIFGDVSRGAPMTVEWSVYAQSLTRRPVKGMLTGPVTMMQWSFVRDDIPRDRICRQIALALRDEVLDLEKAGIGIIQIDEPALREGLPLRKDNWKGYLDWAVDAFRITASGVRDETQIHTHMCYSEFNDIIHSIAAMDADVISIETARSKMELLRAFADFHYPNEIGPGVYDIHAPRVPSVEEIEDLLVRASEHLSSKQLWINPDCGLKTRDWPEVKLALENMVTAALRVRANSARIGGHREQGVE